jgi:hypothetical protein
MRKCTVEGCETGAMSNGLCQTHYGQASGANQTAAKTAKEARPKASILRRVGCKIDGCAGDNWARGLCRVHYRQAAYLGTLVEIGDASKRHVASPPESTHEGPHGYIWRQLPGRRVYEHRYVMEQHLGRKLERWETVHHKDGDKANNELDNLELFSAVPQSAGQRPVDMAKYLLTKHPDVLREVAAELGLAS